MQGIANAGAFLGSELAKHSKRKMSLQPFSGGSRKRARTEGSSSAGNFKKHSPALVGLKRRFMRGARGARSYQSNKIKTIALAQDAVGVQTVKSVDFSSATMLAAEQLIFTDGMRFVLVNDTVVGAAEYQRLGQSTVGKSLRLRYLLTNGSNVISTQPFPQNLNFYLIYDKKPDNAGGLPTEAAVFQSVYKDGTAAAPAAVVGFPAKTNSDRFVILREWTVDMRKQQSINNQFPPNNVMIEGSDASYTGDIYVKLKDLHTIYSSAGAGGGGGLGAMREGAIYIAWRSSCMEAVIVAANAYRMNFISRYTFEDD